MAVSVLSAAKHLAAISGWTLSNLEIQKILYLSHMFHLGRTGEKLVRGDFEAWDYGPVHPTLYHQAKVFGASPVKNVFHNAPDVPPGVGRSIIEEAYASLGDLGPGRLVSITHRPGGAWDRNYIPGQRHRLIPTEDILTEYQGLNGD